VIGLYDQQGILRLAARDQAACLAYAELFGLEDGAFSLQPLSGAEEAGAPSVGRFRVQAV
jgi:hypothetical protein